MLHYLVWSNQGLNAGSIILCACGCGKHIGVLRVGAFREDCARAILTDVRKLQSLQPQVLAFVASALQDAGAAHLASAAIGALPFEVR